MRFFANKSQSLPVTCLRIALLIATLTIPVACAKKAQPVPQGWFLNGQPLTSSSNEAIPTGATVYLPGKFTLEAISDCVVRVVQKQQQLQVDLLYGTAIVSPADAQAAITVNTNGHAITPQVSRFLLQSQIGATKLFVADGAISIAGPKGVQQLAAKKENYFESKSGMQVIESLKAAAIAGRFPELARRRLMAALR